MVLDVLTTENTRVLLVNANGLDRMKDTYAILLRLVWKRNIRRLDVMPIENQRVSLSIAIGLKTTKRLSAQLDVSKLRWLLINVTIVN